MPLSGSPAKTKRAISPKDYEERVWAVDRIRGKEEFRKMVPPTNNTELPLSEQTIADALGRAGYATAMFGKWHLGDEGRYYPSQRGEADQGRQIP